MKLLAQAPINIAPQGGFKGLGTGLFANVGNGIDALTRVISVTVGIMTVVAFIWFVLNVIIGGINIISSEGDKQKLELARHRIFNGIIGIVVVVVAIFFVSLIGSIFGIPFLDLPKLFNQIIQSAGGKTTP